MTQDDGTRANGRRLPRTILENRAGNTEPAQNRTNVLDMLGFLAMEREPRAWISTIFADASLAEVIAQKSAKVGQKGEHSGEGCVRLSAYTEKSQLGSAHPQLGFDEEKPSCRKGILPNRVADRPPEAGFQEPFELVPGFALDPP